MRSIVFILLFIFTGSTAFAGGGWPQAKRKGYFKLSQNWIISNSLYDGKGDIITLTPSVGIFTTSLYAEFGITNRFTAIAYVPFFVKSVKNELRYKQSGQIEKSDVLNSFGDADIGFQYGIVVNKPIVVSASLLLGLPLGNNAGGETKLLQTGDGEFNQFIRVDASHSFYPKPIYASAYVGFNNRTQGFSDEVRFGIEAGYTIKDKLTLIGKINVNQSLFNGGDIVVGNGIFSNNTEYVSPAIEVGYSFTKAWGISASAGFAASGRNILASPNYGVGVFCKLN
jgi:protein XagA